MYLINQAYQVTYEIGYSLANINALPPQFVSSAESGMPQRARVSGGYPSCFLPVGVGAADS